LGLIVDPSGLDFIALGTRPIDHVIGTISKGSHYSIAFFKTGCKVKQWFDQTIEGIDTPMAFMAPNGEAVIYPTSMFRIPPYQKFAVEKVASMELLREGGWFARGFNGKQFKTLPVDISIIVHSDSAKFYFPIYEGTDAQVAKKWKEIESLAENYKYAEQTGANDKFDGQFKKWPWSRYENYIIDGLSVTNSNTFVQYLVAQAKLPTETLLPGWNPETLSLKLVTNTRVINLRPMILLGSQRLLVETAPPVMTKKYRSWAGKVRYFRFSLEKAVT
jgi:hypothetical protein